MVELRSRTHLSSQLHSIRTIKDGSIKILMNMDSKGRPKLKFRQLVDIYNQENSKDDASMTQGSCLFGAEVNVKTDPEDFSMTLEMVRKQCKEKKRKLRNHRDTETASDFRVKQESLTQDEESDLEEPLSSWNTKVSKRIKKNQERKAKRCSTSSPSVEKVDLPVLFDIKPEADDSYLVSEAMDYVSTDPSPGTNNESESLTNVVLVKETMHDSSDDTTLAVYCGAEQSSPGLVAIEESIATKPVEMAFQEALEELDDAMKVQCCLEKKDIVLHDSFSRNEVELAIPQHSESGNTCCVENLICFETRCLCEEVEDAEESNDSTPISVMSKTGDHLGLPNMDFSVQHTKMGFETEDITKDDLPDATDILQLTNYSNSVDTLQPVPDDSTISLEENLFSSSNHEDVAGDDKVSQLNEAPDEVETAPDTDNIHQQKLHNKPEKLLSGRKEALSPSSRAKLCKAMEQPDSPEERSKQSKGKLYFISQASHRILKAGGLDNIDRVNIIPSSKQVIQKANHKPTRKIRRQHTQTAKSQPFSSGSASIQGCSQKAIIFSQGQLSDFQYLAFKLTKQLKTMRQIAKTCLLDENNPSNMSEYNLDEVKTLIGNSERIEKSSKKWLSILERDCNRFCKIMGMVREEDSPATENIVQKKKKINFADDAGGDLCHVKVFDIDLESES